MSRQKYFVLSLAVALVFSSTCSQVNEVCSCTHLDKCETTCCGENVRCNFVSKTQRRCQTCEECNSDLNKCDVFCPPTLSPSFSPLRILSSDIPSPQPDAKIPHVNTTVLTPLSESKENNTLLFILTPLASVCLCSMMALFYYFRYSWNSQEKYPQQIPKVVTVLSAKELECQAGLRAYSVAKAPSDNIGGADVSKPDTWVRPDASRSRYEGDERGEYATRLGPTPKGRPIAISRHADGSDEKYLTTPWKNRFRPLSDASSLDSTGLYRTPSIPHRTDTVSTVDSWGLYRTPSVEKRGPGKLISQISRTKPYREQI